MDIIPIDIPAPWWLRLPIYLLRFIRKTRFGRYVAFHFRNRMDLMLFTELHHKAIHDIRTLTTAQLTLSQNEELAYEYLERAANSCRDVMANAIEMRPEELHATIKIFSADDCHETAVIGITDTEKDIDHNQREKLIERIGNLKVYTLARSTDTENYWAGRPLEIGSNYFHIVSENSSFAAIMGVPDRKSDWQAKPCNCFIENRLTECQQYDSSGDCWSGHYSAAAVFPIRYRHHAMRQPIVVGFLTFDAKKPVFGVLGAYPNIFSFEDPMRYREALVTKTFFHVGGILSDTLLPGLLQYHRNRGANPDNL